MFNKSKKLIIIGVSLIVLSLGLFMNNIHEENVAGKKSNEVLKVIKNVVEKNMKVTYNSGINNDINTVMVDGYDYIGTIIIPSLNIELPVMSTYDYDRLRIAPCRYYGSIYTDDLIICAHSYKTHFKYLDKLEQKDLIIITDIYGVKYVYEVLEIELLSPNDVKEMIDNEFDLTLYTCTSDGLSRITVRCNRVKEVV